MIYIAASFTVDPVEPALQAWCDKLGLNNSIRFSPYNQVLQLLLDPNSTFLYGNQDYNVIFFRFEDLQNYGSRSKDALNIEKLLLHQQELIKALTLYASRINKPTFFIFCPHSMNFNKETQAHIQRAEVETVNRLSNYSNLYISTEKQFLDYYPSDDYEVQNINEAFNVPNLEKWHIPYHEKWYVILGTWAIRQINALINKPYKVLIVDCDNVLWDGVCGESKLLDLKIDKNFKNFQQFLIRQQEKGMLIMLCSKNIDTDVLNVIDNHPDMLLKREHLAGWYINWETKSKNIRTCSEELQLATDSFVFIDDNPIECAEVNSHLPDVLVLQAPKKLQNYHSFLDHLWVFDLLKITFEDQKRTTMYKQNFMRTKALTSTTFEDFIKNLDLKIDFNPLTEEFLPRAYQLIHRTNQFNTTGKRLNENDIKKNIYNMFMINVNDRFGDYGFVGLIHYTIQNTILDIDLFLLSCRVLARGAEYQIVNELIKLAQQYSCEYINFHFIPSGRNLPAHKFLTDISVKVNTTKKGDKELSIFQIDLKKTKRVQFNTKSIEATESSPNLNKPESQYNNPSNFGDLYKEIANNAHNMNAICSYLKISIDDIINTLV